MSISTFINLESLAPVKNVVEVNGTQIPKHLVPFVQFTLGKPSSFAACLPENYWGVNALCAYNNPNYYSSSHIAYEEGYSLETRIAKYSDAISNVLKLWMNKPSGNFIDFGGGPGYFAYGVAKAAIDKNIIQKDKVTNCVSVVDISNQTNQTVEEFGITRIATPISELPQQYRNGQTSVATCFHTMEHIPIKDIPDSIQAMYQSLSHDGILYTIIPTLDGRILQAGNEHVYNQVVFDRTHLTFGSRQWWIDQFESAGFTSNEKLNTAFDQKKYGWVFCFNKS